MKTFKSYIIERKKTKRDVPDNEEHQLLHDDGSAKIYKLNTFKASSEIYGGGAHKGYPKTDWCTASDHIQFNSYSNGAPLYVIHSKDEHGNPQVHQFNDRPHELSFMNANDEPNDFGEFVKKHPDIVKHIKFSTKETDEQFNKDLHTAAIQRAKDSSNSTYGFLDRVSSPDKSHLIISPHLSNEHKALIINTPHERATNLLTNSSSLTDDDAKNILSKEYNTDNPLAHQILMTNIMRNNNTSKEYYNVLFNKLLTHSKNNNLISKIKTLKLTESKHFSDEHANALLDHSDIMNKLSKVVGILNSQKLKPETIDRVMKEYSSHPHRDGIYESIAAHKNATGQQLTHILNNTNDESIKHRVENRLSQINKDQ